MSEWPLFVRAAAVAGFLALALVLISSAHAEAHCYSRWYYPFSQRCVFARLPTPRHLAALTDHYAMPHRPVTLNPIGMLRAAMIGVVK